MAERKTTPVTPADDWQDVDASEWQDVDPAEIAAPAQPPEQAAKPSSPIDIASRAGGRFLSNTAGTVGKLLTTDPRETGKGMFQYTSDAVGRTKEAFRSAAQQQTPEAQTTGFMRAIPPALGMIPFVGPGLEQLAGDVQEGNWPEAAGDIGSMAAFARAPQIARGTARAVKNVASKPTVMKAAGGAAGAAAGHATGIPYAGYAGAHLGWKLGGELAKKAGRATDPPAPAIPPIWDDIARGQGGKSYSALPPEAQATVRDIATRIESASATAPPIPMRMPEPRRPVMTDQPAPPTAAPAPASKPMEPMRVSGAEVLSLEDQLQTSLDMVRSGQRPSPVIPPDPTVEVAPIVEGMRPMEPGMRTEMARSNYRAVKQGQSAPETAGAAFEAAGRGNKAGNAATMLYDEGLTARKVARWDDARWKQEFETRGLKPPSKATIQETKVQLRQMAEGKGK